MGQSCRGRIVARSSQAGILNGSEVVWLEDSLSAYIVHVNGSARLQLPDGSDLYLGYGGKTDRPVHGAWHHSCTARAYLAG